MAATALDVGASLSGGRFTVVRRIGTGGMGAVYEVFDAERKGSVALKTLLTWSAAQIYRLKNEFRALADVRHPNLVTLHELFSDQDRWFFTMELVEGVAFDRWVRPAGLSESRLRSVLPQLIAGMDAIHRAGKLHCDLKPSNVLVTPQGRVVILDFGLMVDHESGKLARAEDDLIVGTPAYMAPEQATGDATTPATDFYALGVMLFESLTGCLPFAGRAGALLMAKHAQSAPRAAAITANLPADLELTCAELLRRDPAGRPDSARLRALFGAPATEPRASRSTPPDAPFELFGRERELAILRTAYDEMVSGKPVLVWVDGESGIGKSALVGTFLDELRWQGSACVLAGRCHERENIPYKGLDSLIDNISRQLQRLPAHEAATLLPREAHALARLFPVLSRVTVMADAPRKDIPDLRDLQERGFAAFGELIARLRERIPTVLFIDDMQWTDADSVRLMRQLLVNPQPAPVMMVLARRTHERESGSILLSLERAAAENRSLSVQKLCVEGLGEAALIALIEKLLADHLERAGLARRLAQEAHGSPFFAGAIARATGQRSDAESVPALSEALSSHVANLSSSQRRVLSVLAVAAQPLSPSIVAVAAGVEDGHSELDVLRSERLVRISTADEHGRRVECYHDKVREVVAGELSPELTRDLCAGLADALGSLSDADPELLTRCFEGAGKLAAAAAQAVRGAERAMHALAFDRAARQYQKALTLGAFADGELGELRVACADALARSGQGVAAAEMYLLARANTNAAETSSLTQKAAEQYLMCGHTMRGRELFAEGLRPLGLSMPSTPLAAFLSLLWSRWLLRVRGFSFVPRPHVAPRALAQLDALRRATSGLARTDVVRFAAFSSKRMRLALGAGHALEVARAVGWELRLASGLPAARKRIPALEQLSASLPESESDTEAQVHRHYGSARCCWTEFPWRGRFLDSLTHMDQALHLTKTQPYATATYDEPWFQWLRANNLLALGRLRELGPLVEAQFERALANADLTVLPLWAHVAAQVLPALGQLASAERIVAEMRARWQCDEVTLQDVYALHATSLLAASRGQPTLAWQDFRASLQRIEASLLPLIFFGKSLAAHGAGFAAAAVADTSDARVRAQAMRDVVRLGKRASRGAPVTRLMAQIALASSRGQRALVVNGLRTILALPDLSPLYGHVIQRRLGKLLDEAEGQALVLAADAWLEERGVIDPELTCDVMLPGAD